MDPITRAAHAFMSEADAVFAAGRRVLRIVAGASDRSSLVKALRLMEWRPDNRRPFFLYEEPFEAPEAYFDRLARRVHDDYERVRAGVAEELADDLLGPAI